MRLIRRLRFRGLAAQIVLWTVLPLTLVLIGVAFTGVYSHEQAMRTLVEERDRALGTSAASQVRDLVVGRAAGLQKLGALLATAGSDAAQQRALLSAAGDVALLDDAANLLVSGAVAPGWTSGQAVADLVRAVTARQGVALSPMLDAGQSPAPQGLPSPGRDLFLMGVPVFRSDGAMYGVLAATVSLSDLGLRTVLDRVEVGEHGAVYLAEPTGRVLAHSASPHARASLAGHSGMIAASQADGPGATECRSPEGERMVLAYAPLDMGSGWLVIVEQPWHATVSPVLRYSQFMPLVAALAAVVAVLTLYYGIHSLALPLRALKRQAEQVAWGDFDATATPVGGVEEIEDLRRTLDQMSQRIQGYQRGMHGYIAAITQGQEEERKRLARELHDDTAQALIALGQQVEMAQKQIAGDPARAAERLAGVQALLGEALEGVRRFSRDLRPIYLEDLGFLPALEMLVSEASRHEGLTVEATTVGTPRRLSPSLELAAFRIVQEALNNVVQHAQASHAWVEVRFESQHLALSVRDDGRGFEAPDQPDVLARQGHFGLMGIQERALLYGGRATIRSAPGQGTEVTVRMKAQP